MESNFGGGLFQPSHTPPLHTNPYYHQQSQIKSFSSPFNPYPPNPWAFPAHNQYAQFNPFSPNPWTNGHQFVDPHSWYIHPNNQTDIPLVNPIQVVPLDTGSKNSYPNPPPALSTLHNLVNGKSNYFAPIQKNSPSPISRKKTRAKKKLANQEEGVIDQSPKGAMPINIHTRSTD